MDNRIDGEGEDDEQHRCCTAAPAVLMLVPSEAVTTASSLGGIPRVALYTAVAIAAVLVVAALVSAGLNLAVRFGVIGRGHRVAVRRRLRVGFGVIFLLAAVTPWVALNFSAGMLVLFVGAAGTVVAGWVWGASRNQRFESDAPTHEA